MSRATDSGSVGRRPEGERKRDGVLTRDRAFLVENTALLVIDVQNAVFSAAEAEKRPWFYEIVRERVLPNQKRLIVAARKAGFEIIYTVMENLTRDGRDRSLDYKLSNFFIEKGSWEAEVVPDVAPAGDDIVLPKTSSSVFNSTILAYLLRNIGIENVIAFGFLTDQCVDQAIRDGADLGFYMNCVSDASATETAERHANALAAFSGYCRTLTTDDCLELIAGASDK